MKIGNKHNKSEKKFNSQPNFFLSNITEIFSSSNVLMILSAFEI